MTVVSPNTSKSPVVADEGRQLSPVHSKSPKRHSPKARLPSPGEGHPTLKNAFANQRDDPVSRLRVAGTPGADVKPITPVKPDLDPVAVIDEVLQKRPSRHTSASPARAVTPKDLVEEQNFVYQDVDRHVVGAYRRLNSPHDGIILRDNHIVDPAGQRKTSRSPVKDHSPAPPAPRAGSTSQPRVLKLGQTLAPPTLGAPPAPAFRSTYTPGALSFVPPMAPMFSGSSVNDADSSNAAPWADPRKSYGTGNHMQRLHLAPRPLPTVGAVALPHRWSTNSRLPGRDDPNAPLLKFKPLHRDSSRPAEKSAKPKTPTAPASPAAVVSPTTPPLPLVPPIRAVTPTTTQVASPNSQENPVATRASPDTSSSSKKRKRQSQGDPTSPAVVATAAPEASIASTSSASLRKEAQKRQKVHPGSPTSPPALANGHAPVAAASTPILTGSLSPQGDASSSAELSKSEKAKLKKSSKKSTGAPEALLVEHDDTATSTRDEVSQPNVVGLLACFGGIVKTICGGGQ